MSEQSTVSWRRSSACHGGTCVEVAKAGSVILVQDSKSPAAAGGVMQAWEIDEWWQLLAALRTGEPHPGVDPLGISRTQLGLHRHEPLVFRQSDWWPFVEGAKAGEFDPDKLSSPADSAGGSESAGRQVGADAPGSDLAATGAGLPSGQSVPVAAHEPLADAAPRKDLVAERLLGGAASADGPGLRPDPATGAGGAGAALSRPVPVAAKAGPSPVNPSSSDSCAGRRDHDPLSASRDLPETAQPSLDVPVGRQDPVSPDTGVPPQEADRPGPRYGDMIVRKVEPKFIVEHAPARSLISLGVLRAYDERALFVSGDRVYIGEDLFGNEVVYRVTGWDADACGLVIERETPAIEDIERAVWEHATAPLTDVPEVPATTETPATPVVAGLKGEAGPVHTPGTGPAEPGDEATT